MADLPSILLCASSYLLSVSLCYLVICQMQISGGWSGPVRAVRVPGKYSSIIAQATPGGEGEVNNDGSAQHGLLVPTS
jgi:hypothetical protein